MKIFKRSAFIVTTLIMSMALLTACSETPKKENQAANGTTAAKSTSSTDLNKAKVFTDISITPKSFKLKQDDTFKEKGKTLTVVAMHIENKTKSDFGIGAGDFYLLLGKEKIASHGYYDSFGDVIKPSKTLDGNAYFAIPDVKGDYKLVYHPVNGPKTPMLEWSIGSPTK
ncbi:lipoprotein [Listeria fleischmannii 1991]|uniref:Telomeric repeat-binding factor 2 n=2 Tax=Listeria fleischmannii TaxID=1069827 RepID=A0A2X3J8B4_9LIST|nr:DUF4352 domain-containing protein [Listeria fleischmannii]EMG27670.1 hypothetical protein LFLEISCH_09914 [Listeria fleischmannii subsp. fleischmannii LU2006-1]KMT60357.1 lipoprotein [Listeria fleischmannii 1991]SQC70440.1 Telomeric repeat-binding factor 2 [Listeria fleischmannii subsp. fleischmannii]